MPVRKEHEEFLKKNTGDGVKLTDLPGVKKVVEENIEKKGETWTKDEEADKTDAPKK